MTFYGPLAKNAVTLRYYNLTILTLEPVDRLKIDRRAMFCNFEKYDVATGRVG